MLRVDPQQRARLVEIARNLTDRITEARFSGGYQPDADSATEFQQLNGYV